MSANQEASETIAAPDRLARTPPHPLGTDISERCDGRHSHEMEFVI